MLGALKLLERVFARGEDEVAQATEEERERRLDERHDFTGHVSSLFFGIIQYELHLKDLSCKGASGLTDAPLKRGQLIGVEIGRKHFVTAEVRWTRNSKAGVAFLEPLEYEYVTALHARHRRRRAKPDWRR
jgi:hypothetical protein